MTDFVSSTILVETRKLSSKENELKKEELKQYFVERLSAIEREIAEKGEANIPETLSELFCDYQDKYYHNEPIDYWNNLAAEYQYLQALYILYDMEDK